LAKKTKELWNFSIQPPQEKKDKKTPCTTSGGREIKPTKGPFDRSRANAKQRGPGRGGKKIRKGGTLRTRVTGNRRV